MLICFPHTIAVCGMYALTGYPVTRLDVGLSTYRRAAAGEIDLILQPLHAVWIPARVAGHRQIKTMVLLL